DGIRDDLVTGVQTCALPISICFNSDVVATAKRSLGAGEILDGEGGFCVWGKQTPAETSLEHGLLPLGLAQNVKLTRDIAEGEALDRKSVGEGRRGEVGGAHI